MTKFKQFFFPYGLLLLLTVIFIGAFSASAKGKRWNIEPVYLKIETYNGSVATGELYVRTPEGKWVKVRVK